MWEWENKVCWLRAAGHESKEPQTLVDVHNNFTFYQVWPDFSAASTWAFPRSISTLTIELYFISAATVGVVGRGCGTLVGSSQRAPLGASYECMWARGLVGSWARGLVGS